MSSYQEPDDGLVAGVAGFILLVIVILLLALQSCRVQAPIVRTDTVTRVEVRQVVKDTTVFVTDSAGFRALLECDSLGRVRVKQIEDYYAGQYVKPKVVIRDNYIKIGCNTDSAAISVKWIETHSTSSQSAITVKVERVNYLTSWQWAQVWLGRLMLALTIIYIGVLLVKRYTGIRL